MRVSTPVSSTKTRRAGAIAALSSPHPPPAPATSSRGRAAALLAGGPQPAGERPLADPVALGDPGLAALAGLAGGEHPLAQVGGVGTRHRSPPVGVKAIPTADRGAGSVDGHAIGSSPRSCPRGSLPGPPP